MPEFKDGYKSTPVKCPVGVSSPSNPTYSSQQEGAKVKKPKAKKGK